MLLLVAVTLFRLLKPLKIFALLALPIVMGTVIAKPEDLVWVIATSVILTVIAFSAFVNNYVNFESRFVQWFSEKTASPRWFTMWVLLMVLWIPVRHLLTERGWLTNDTDFIVATLLWSCVPFMVENALKVSSARSMKSVEALSIDIRNAQDHAAAKDDLMIAALHKLLQAISPDSEEVNTLDSGGDRSSD